MYIRARILNPVACVKVILNGSRRIRVHIRLSIQKFDYHWSCNTNIFSSTHRTILKMIQDLISGPIEYACLKRAVSMYFLHMSQPQLDVRRLYSGFYSDNHSDRPQRKLTLRFAKEFRYFKSFNNKNFGLIRVSKRTL